MWIGFVGFFLFFFVRGFVQQRKRQRIARLQREVDHMKKVIALRKETGQPVRK